MSIESDRRAESTARRRAHRRAIRRRRLIAALAPVAIGAVLAFSLGGGSAAPGSRPTAARVTSRGRTLATRTIAPAQPAAASPSPGSLPQTRAIPSATSPRFRSLMGLLWAGIVRDSTARALPAFFPKAAYLQLKSIVDAGADWSARLVHDYALDIAAAHHHLGRGAGAARLIRVEAVASYAHWIQPGVCDNRIGYYEMPDARVLYREDGRVRSFGIASMISWRGVWYVVHLGAILRSTDSGVVDDPSAGAGVSAYSGTC